MTDQMHNEVNHWLREHFNLLEPVKPLTAQVMRRKTFDHATNDEIATALNVTPEVVRAVVLEWTDAIVSAMAITSSLVQIIIL